MYPVTYMLATICQDSERPQVLDTLHMPNILFHPIVTCIKNKHPCIVFKKAWLYLRHGWVWCGAIPHRCLIILASVVSLQQQHKWARWSSKSCSMLCPDLIVLTDKAPPPINMAALICWLQATIFCWSGELLHWNMLWRGCSNIELTKMFNWHVSEGDSTCLTVTCKLALAQLELCYLLTCFTKSQVSTGCPVVKANHMICSDNRTWCYCLVRSLCHVWCPSGHC